MNIGDILMASSFLLFIILVVLIFNVVFGIIVRYYYRTIFTEKYSKIKAQLGKPIKTVNMTLIDDGHNGKSSIPVKLEIYQDYFLASTCGNALLINDFTKTYFQTDTYYENVEKFIKTEKIKHVRELFVICAHPFTLKHILYQNDADYLKNYLKEKNNV